VRPTDRAEVGLAEFARVCGVPSHDFAADFGLAVTVEHHDAELVLEPPSLQR